MRHDNNLKTEVILKIQAVIDIHLVNIFQCYFRIFVFVDKSQKLVLCTNEIRFHRTVSQQNTKFNNTYSIIST